MYLITITTAIYIELFFLNITELHKYYIFNIVLVKDRLALYFLSFQDTILE